MSHPNAESAFRPVTRALVALAWRGTLLAIAIGATVSAGWFLGIHAMLAGYIVMKTDMAVALLFSGMGGESSSIWASSVSGAAV